MFSKHRSCGQIKPNKCQKKNSLHNAQCPSLENILSVISTMQNLGKCHANLFAFKQ